MTRCSSESGDPPRRCQNTFARGRPPPGARSVRRGPRWLFSYGGGGGLLCVEAAEALGIHRVVVFPHSSVFSAFGAGLLPIAHSYQTVVPAGAGRRGNRRGRGRLADNARRDLRAEGVRALDGSMRRLR